MRWFSLLLAVLLLSYGGGFRPSYADDGITVLYSSVENKFPKEVVFRLEVSSSSEIDSIVLYYVVGSSDVLQYRYMEFTPGKTVKGEVALSTSGNAYIPPGNEVEYYYEIKDKGGNRVLTDKKVFSYADTRFDWKTLQRGLGTVYWYGRAEEVAKTVLAGALGAVEKMSVEAGVQGIRPFRVMVYNSVAEMNVALPPKSEAYRQEMITAGQAYAEYDLLLLLGMGSTLGVRDTVAHEVAHLIVHKAAGRYVPSWLNEGLAVYAQSDPGFEYTLALKGGIAQDKLLLLRGMDTMPGSSDDIILFYGQAHSIVKYLIETYGPEKMRRLLASFKDGEGSESALQKVYGLGRDELDAKWRQSVGAKPRRYEQVIPTAIPIPTIAPSGLGAQPTPIPNTPSSQASSPGVPGFLLVVGGAFLLLLAAVGTAAVFVLRRQL